MEHHQWKVSIMPYCALLNNNLRCNDGRTMLYEAEAELHSWDFSHGSDVKLRANKSNFYCIVCTFGAKMKNEKLLPLGA